MALKRLRTQEMVTISSTMVDPAHADHQAMVTVPALAALMPEITGSHNGLYATYFTGPNAVRLKEIQTRQKQLDGGHDDIARGLSAYLWALIYFARTDEARLALHQLLALLLPDGLAIIKKSYREEAGQAALIESRLGDAERAILTEMVLPDGRTLLDVVTEWLRIGAELATLDRERAGDLSDDAPTPGEALAARNRWIRTMQAVRDVAALVAAGDPAIDAIMTRLDEAERAADRRAPDDAENDAEVPGSGDDLPAPAPVAGAPDPAAA